LDKKRELPRSKLLKMNREQIIEHLKKKITEIQHGKLEDSRHRFIEAGSTKDSPESSPLFRESQAGLELCLKSLLDLLKIEYGRKHLLNDFMPPAFQVLEKLREENLIHSPFGPFTEERFIKRTLSMATTASVLTCSVKDYAIYPIKGIEWGVEDLFATTEMKKVGKALADLASETCQRIHQLFYWIEEAVKG